MSKITTTLLVSLVLIGCEQLQNHQANQANPKALMKWAMVDKNKIDKSLMELIKKNNPAPAELGNEEESYRDRAKIERQISEIEGDAEKKCVNANTVSDKKNSYSENTSHAGIAPRAPSMSSSEGGFNINGHYVPLSAINNSPRITNQDNYRECLSNISKDPLIADLREQVNKLDKVRLERKRYEDEIRKKASEYTKLMLTKYAEANSFELIVGNNHGGDYVLYNADKVSLDVTDDVLDFISKRQEITTNTIDNNLYTQK